MSENESKMAELYAQHVIENEPYPGKTSELELYLKIAWLAGRRSIEDEHSGVDSATRRQND